MFLDVPDGQLTKSLLAAEALLSRDDYCMNYIQARRQANS